MDITILLIVESEHNRNAYLAALDLPGVTVVASPSFTRLPADAVAEAFHGVLVDLPTKIRALKEHRDFVYRILGSFPLAQLTHDRRTGKVSVFYHGQEGVRTLEDFLYTQCRGAAARQFRYHRRKTVHFHVYVSGIGSDAAVKSTTLNLSRGGCFIYSTDACPPGTVLTLQFTADPGSEPVQAVVRHAVAWNTPMQLCGLGVAFAADAAGQLEAIFQQAGL